MKTWATLGMVVMAFLFAPLAQAQGTVARSIITTAVEDREPTNDLTEVPASEERVLFFTDLRGMAGQTIKHRWLHAGEQVAEVDFNVGGPRWRIWSSKSMIPDWQGNWTVQVIDGNGQVVAEKQFSYGAAEAAMSTMAPEGEAPEEGAPGETMAPAEAPMPAAEPDTMEAMPAE
jgi:hypothetical protein